MKAALAAAGSPGERRPGLAPASLGLWVFLSTLVMLFAAFASSYLVRRTGSDWVPLELPWIFWANTGVLAASSSALIRASRTRGSGRVRWLAVTFVLGILFLLGQLGGWWQLERGGVGVATLPQASFLYILTGLHGLHLAGGLVFLAYTLAHVARAARREGGPDARGRHLLELASTYWHFLGLLWVFLFVLLLGG